MRRVPFHWWLLLVVFAAACGHKIGDSCTVSTDCSQDGTRVCDTSSPGGSCTIQGCDWGTCPDEAVCVRFFPALADAKSCATTGDCALDEVCTIGHLCAPRSIEQRFCMLACDGNGDCRSDYECRDKTFMAHHGGEPVPNPRANPDAGVPDIHFCAAKLRCLTDSDCPTADTCSPQSLSCVPTTK